VTSQGRDVTESTARLREALEEIAAALQAADLDRLLRAEAQLELVLRRLAVASRDLTTSERETVRLEIRAARQALNRCRTLGATLLDVVRNPGYGRQQDSPVLYGPRALNARG